jgi:hypothetical protein
MGVADVDHVFAEAMNARAFSLLLTALASVMAPAAQAHTPGHSYVRVTLSETERVISFAFDFATLRVLGDVDANGDRAITPDELAAFAPVMEKLLRASVAAQLDDAAIELGEFVAASWPGEAGAAIREADEHRHFAIMRFRHAVKSRPGRMTLSFDFHGRLGDRHTVLGTFAAAGQEERVVFSGLQPSHRFVVPAPRQNEPAKVAAARP